MQKHVQTRDYQLNQDLISTCLGKYKLCEIQLLGSQIIFKGYECVDVRQHSAYSSSCKIRKKWFLDLPFQECLLYCSLWVFQKIPLHNLDWDPVGNQWKKPSVGGNGKHLEFFQYSVKLGRNLLLQSKYKCIVVMKHWTANNVHALQLTIF